MMNMYVMLMLMLWDVNICLTPRGVTAQQGHLQGFAFFLCDAQPLHEHLPCFALRVTTAKQWLLGAHCARTACSAYSFPSVASLGDVVVEEAGIVG
jgi:hypothetical protein